MEEDIQNYVPTVICGGTPCMSNINNVILLGQKVKGLYLKVWQLGCKEKELES